MLRNSNVLPLLELEVPVCSLSLSWLYLVARFSFSLVSFIIKHATRKVINLKWITLYSNLACYLCYLILVLEKLAQVAVETFKL